MSAKGFMNALTTDKSRAEFLDQIISLVVKFNFAGVAFHWIYPGCPQVFCCIFLMDVQHNMKCALQGECKFKKDRDRLTGLANEVLRPLREMGLKTFYFYSINIKVSMDLGEVMTTLSITDLIKLRQATISVKSAHTLTTFYRSWQARLDTGRPKLSLIIV